MVKQNTIKKYVEFLNEFKGLADSNAIINMAALVNKYHINSSIHLHAVKLGYFDRTDDNGISGWRCNLVTFFEPYHARRLAEVINEYNKSPRYKNVCNDYGQSHYHLRTSINISFDDFWNLYDKKVGDKQKLEKTWNKLSDKDRSDIMEFIPKYKEARPDKTYRKDPKTFFNNRTWNDEIVSQTYTKIIPSTPVQNNYPLSHYSDQQLWDELKRRGYEGKILKGLE